MQNINLGYACINMQLSAKKISTNKTCTRKTLKEKGIGYAVELANSNLKNLLYILKWNFENNIKLYRISSDILPHITDPEFISDEKFAYPIEQFADVLKTIGEYAKKTCQRLSFHPSQFNQIGANTEDVFKKTCLDLEYQATILDLMELDNSSVLVVHGGGTYKNKDLTIERWCKQFFMLPENVQKRIALENCERQYSILDTISISDKIYLSSGFRIPLIFDTHHHECWEQIYDVKIPIKSFLKAVLKSWKNRVPKFHVSEQDSSKRIGAHSEYVEDLPKFFFIISKYIKVDIMIEAKCKEQAVEKLMKKYN